MTSEKAFIERKKLEKSYYLSSNETVVKSFNGDDKSCGRSPTPCAREAVSGQTSQSGRTHPSFNGLQNPTNVAISAGIHVFSQQFLERRVRQELRETSSAVITRCGRRVLNEAR